VCGAWVGKVVQHSNNVARNYLRIWNLAESFADFFALAESKIFFPPMVRPEVNSITKSDTFREIPSSIFFNHYWNLKVPLFDFHITVLSRLHESDIIYLKMSVCGKV